MTSTLFTVLMGLLFFANNGQVTLLRIPFSSGSLVPYGQVSIGSDAINTLVQLFIECAVLGLKLALPVLAAEFLGQIGMGVLMKVIPQINVFSINIELKILIGLSLLLLFITPMSQFLLRAENQMLSAVEQLLKLAWCGFSKGDLWWRKAIKPKSISQKRFGDQRKKGNVFLSKRRGGGGHCWWALICRCGCFCRA